MKTVVIDRSKWNSGKRYPSPKLLNEEDGGHMCCLGFLGRACGLADTDLADRVLPDDSRKDLHFDGRESPWPEALFRRDAPLPEGKGGCRTWENLLAIINDDEDADDDDREMWIAEGFRTVLGYEVEFVGEYPEAKP